MSRLPLAKRCALTVFLAVLPFPSYGTAQTRKEYNFAAGPGLSVSVINEYGRISVQPATTRHISVIAVSYSDKAIVDTTQKGNRIEFRTRLAGHPSGKDAKVEYQVQLPPDANVTIRSADGPLRVEGMQGDVSVEGETAVVEIANFTNGHVHINTVNGPVSLTNVKNAFVDVTSLAGSITMMDVSGPKIGASTGSGKIRFSGDCAGGGTYSLVNHAGDTEVILPARASVDMSARSLKGRVMNEFPFESKQGGGAAGTSSAPEGSNSSIADGKALTGTSNAGASSIRVNSFSGTITVREQ